MTPYKTLKQAQETLKHIEYLTSLHQRSNKTAQAVIEDELESLLESVSKSPHVPLTGSLWSCKKDMYRFNCDFKKGHIVKVVSVMLSNKSFVVVDYKGRTINVDLLDYFKLFRKENLIKV